MCCSVAGYLGEEPDALKAGKEGTNVSILRAMCSHCLGMRAPWMAHQADTALCHPWLTLLCAIWVTTCEVGFPNAQGSWKRRRVREDFVAETWTPDANFAAAYLRHMHGTNRYCTALMGDSPSGVSDGGKVGHSAVLKITLNVCMEANPHYFVPKSHPHYFVCDKSNCLASAVLPALGIYQALSVNCFLFLFEYIQELVVLVFLPAFLFFWGT